jgi:predicted XRE-type DNA-binding protein
MEDKSSPVLVSGNIFADLNIPNAEEELEKAQLAHAIRSIIKANGWTQEQAAKQIGTSQPKVSQIIGGRLAGFTTDRLLKYVRVRECDVEIRIMRKPADNEHGSVTIHCAI